MSKFEITKTVEAVKLNKRTMRVQDERYHTIPYGSIVNDVVRNQDKVRFTYLGEPYEALAIHIWSALREIE